MMKKPTLGDYNITESQYDKYCEYKRKVTLRDNRIERAGDNYIYVLLIAFYPVVLYKAFTADHISHKLTEFSFFGEYWSLIGFSILLVLVVSISYLIVGFIWGIVLNVILMFLKFPEFVMYIYSKINRPVKRDLFYANIEKFDRDDNEYNKYINELVNDFPSIVDFNYDKQQYFAHIFENIVAHEMELLNKAIRRNNERKQIEYWLSLGGIQFEKEVTEIYRKQGYKVETTRAVADGGVDVKMWKNDEYIIVQCKNHRNKIGPSVARDLFGTMHKEGANKAILICSGGFNPGVFDFVKNLPIELLDIHQLIEITHQVYPNQQEKISSTTSSFCFNHISTFEFKVISNVYILFSLHKKSIQDNSTNSTSHPSEHQISLFKTLDEAKNTLEVIKKHHCHQFNEQCFYDIAEWKPRDVRYSYSAKKIFYIRVVDKKMASNKLHINTHES